jgi:hypothetical protein
LFFIFISLKLVDLGVFVTWELPYPKIYSSLGLMLNRTHLIRVLSRNNVQVCNITRRKIFIFTLLWTFKRVHIVSFHFLNPIYMLYLYFLVNIE